MKRYLLFFVLFIVTTSLAAQGEEWLWAKQAGGTDSDFGEALATDASGNCYVSGSFRDTASFGNYSLASSGYNDIFVAKLCEPVYQVLAPHGSENWQAGMLKTVYWYCNYSPQVNVLLSWDNGQNWIPLNSSPIPASQGRFSFIVPYLNSDQ